MRVRDVSRASHVRVSWACNLGDSHLNAHPLMTTPALALTLMHPRHPQSQAELPPGAWAAGLHASTAAALWTTRWQQTPSFLLAPPRFLAPSCQTLVFSTNTPSALSFPLRKQGMLLSNPGLVIDKYVIARRSFHLS